MECSTDCSTAARAAARRIDCSTDCSTAARTAAQCMDCSTARLQGLQHDAWIAARTAAQLQHDALIAAQHGCKGCSMMHGLQRSTAARTAARCMNLSRLHGAQHRCMGCSTNCSTSHGLLHGCTEHSALQGLQRTAWHTALLQKAQHGCMDCSTLHGSHLSTSHGMQHSA